MLTVQELSGRFAGVSWRGKNSFQAKCPCHDDRQASLTVSEGEKGLVLYCHSGCQTEDILKKIGLSFSDIMPEREKPATKKKTSWGKQVASYDYQDITGKIKLRKFKYVDEKGKKNYPWQRYEDGKWQWKINNAVANLYGLDSVKDDSSLFCVEGEKDVETMISLGFQCVTFPNGGSQTKWFPEYEIPFRNRYIYILSDNDKTGRDYAEFIAKNIKPTAKAVYILDLSTEWTDIPPKADISDYYGKFGREQTLETISKLCTNSEEWTPSTVTEEDSFLSCFKPLTAFEEQDPEWLVPFRIPKGQISLLCSDGGAGKTTTACDLIAAISSGKPCFLDDTEIERKPMLTALLSTEDSVSQKLKRKLREAGADMNNVLCPDFSADSDGILRDFKFGTSQMAAFIEHFQPALCIFDPLQGFTPVNVNMGQRNQMRDCLAPFIGLGEKYGTTFLILCHSNKRKAAYGRDRIADSADLWDISRSVLMIGYTDKPGQRCLSHEKSNYGELSQTILFSIKDGKIIDEGRSWKRDREWQEEGTSPNSAPKRQDCKDWILCRLESENGVMKIRDLEADAKNEGFTAKVIRQAKDALKEEDRIYYRSVGFGNEKAWMVYLTD